jgi:hypothetical protein
LMLLGLARITSVLDGHLLISKQDFFINNLEIPRRRTKQQLLAAS